MKRPGAAQPSNQATKSQPPSSGSQQVPADLEQVTLGEVEIHRGSGGETHQLRGDDVQPLTTQLGVPIADDQNTLTAGARGPQLLEDFVMREKIFHFDHERIPERVVHARGFGVRGSFETYESLADITRADIFQRPGEKTDVFVRFSTVVGNKGSTDLARDVRGFATKFYTKEGNWDLVGNNMPVFFIQDAMKFPDLVHSIKAEPDRGFPQATAAHDNFWDFVSLMPESMHMIMWVMSDRAIPRSFRFMEGFGVHTFRFVNANGRSTFVKFHWKPKLGLQSVIWDEAVKISGANPDFHRRDLWNAIESGDAPEWDLGIQLFDDAFADRFEFDVLDATKLIPEEQIPVRVIGRMTLHETVDNFFAETEQVAFCTQNVVPGIDFSNDPLLQGRNFSYLDTQLKRLGSPNFMHLPVNAPRCPFAHFQQDGHMAFVNPKGRVNYEPNSWGDDGGPRESPSRGYRSVPETMSGDKRRIRPELFADHYSQARQFYISQTAIEQQHIANALIFELSKVDRAAIRERVVASVVNIDQGLASRVADGLGLERVPEPLPPAMQTRHDLPESPALSILKNGPSLFAGRRIGVLVDAGSDAVALEALSDAAKAEGAKLALVGPSRQGVRDSTGNPLEIEEKIEGGPSVMFDAIAVVLSDAGASRMASNYAAREFVADAHHHYKFIAYDDGAQALLDAAGINASMRDDGYHSLKAAATATGFIKACRDLRYWDRLGAK
jgi:catalase